HSARWACVVSSTAACLAPVAALIRLATSRRCARARLRASGGTDEPASPNTIKSPLPPLDFSPSTMADSFLTYSRCRLRRIVEDVAGFLSSLGAPGAALGWSAHT